MNLELVWNNNTLKKYFVKETFAEIIANYSEKGRYFHNLSHLEEILGMVGLYKQLTENKSEFEILEMAAFFHDVVYNPQSNTNEEDSCSFLLEHIDYHIEECGEEIETIIKIIHSTKDPFGKDKSELEKSFCHMDCNVLHFKNMKDLLEYEDKIFKEFSTFPISKYRMGRSEFLRNAGKAIGNDYLNSLAGHVFTKKYNVGIYPGSFNPFHIGHLNILEKAEKIFDKVIVAVGNNTNKINDCIYELPEYVEKHYQVVFYDGLLPDLIKSQEEDSNSKITLIRGLRNGNDFEYEKNQLRFINDYHKVNTVHIMCDPQYDHISSSSIRQLDKMFNADVKKYLVS